MKKTLILVVFLLLLVDLTILSANDTLGLKIKYGDKIISVDTAITIFPGLIQDTIYLFVDDPNENLSGLNISAALHYSNKNKTEKNNVFVAEYEKYLSNTGAVYTFNDSANFRLLWVTNGSNLNYVRILKIYIDGQDSLLALTVKGKVTVTKKEENKIETIRDSVMFNFPALTDQIIGDEDDSKTITIDDYRYAHIDLNWYNRNNFIIENDYRMKRILFIFPWPNEALIGIMERYLENPENALAQYYGLGKIFDPTKYGPQVLSQKIDYLKLGSELIIPLPEQDYRIFAYTGKTGKKFINDVIFINADGTILFSSKERTIRKEENKLIISGFIEDYQITEIRGSAPGFDFQTDYFSDILETKKPEILEITAYPNPFRQSLIIRTNKETPEQIKIYNCLGILQKTINLENSEYIWKALDEHNQTITPGVYFLRAKGKVIQIIKE